MSRQKSSIPATPELRRVAFIHRRISISSATADVLADLAFGSDRRDHGSLLAGLIADRVTSYGARI